MAWKWKPNKTQRREFAIKMQDETFAKEYLKRKAQKQEQNRANSKFDYASAGGYYIATKQQHDFCLKNMGKFSSQELNAAGQVIFSFACQEKTHHDNIHIVNELMRKTI